MFPGPLGVSLAGHALQSGLWRMEILDMREYTDDKRRSIDDAPYGGGQGMVMRPDVIDRAMQAASISGLPEIALTPRGKPLDQRRVRMLAEGLGATLLCGRYEGIDDRVIQARGMEEISLGDFVLSGGELAAMALVDCCVRLLPGVVAGTLTDESFESGLLEHPHYTRPQSWGGISVPEILTSGSHERIAAWRRDQSIETTKQRRPDLWQRWLRKQ